MICKNCKKEMPDNANFCRVCGFLNQNKYTNKTLSNIGDKTVTPSVTPTPVITPPVIATPPKTDDTMELPSVPIESPDIVADEEELQPDNQNKPFSFNKKPLIICAIAILLFIIGVIAVDSSKQNNLKNDDIYTEYGEVVFDESDYFEEEWDEETAIETEEQSEDGDVEVFSMPDVVGENYENAESILKSKGLTVYIEYNQTDDFPANSVIGQSISAGSGVATDDSVSLIVAVKQDTIKSVNVVGKNKNVAISSLEDQGLNVIVFDVFDSDIAEGRIISQHPEGGTEQIPGSNVHLYVSKGPDTVKMPNVVNRHIDDAEEILTSKGFFVNVEYKRTDNVKENHVIKQSYKKGEKVDRGACVTLTVASGRETIDVANVVGKISSSANDILSEQGFDIEIAEKYDSNVEKGYIISQKPAANTAQLPGSTITIYVSKGKQPVIVYFNANGGNTTSSQKTVYLTDIYGSLPTPTRTGYTFNGWYTATSDGKKITSSTTVSSSSNHTLYAVWTINSPSDWVLESEVPAGAEILSTRYIYDKTTRETTTSSKSSLSGWTRYDKKTETIYKNVTYYNYVVYGLYHNGDYTYAFSSSRDDIIRHCKNSFNYDPYAVCYKITYSTTSKLTNGVKGNYSGCKATSLDGKKSATISIKNTVLFENGTSTKKVASGTKTTYYYERYLTETSLISTTDPTSSASNITISNVRKQVKYRPK
ncbi:MAG: PASTA domain-containing protein [Ruminococcaceae bacterium]|nr:PASTA domain-containing protein [Oscillospiraceae bacterium]